MKPIKKTFDYPKYPKKINAGCGFDYRKGYLNVDLNDFHKPDLVSDISCMPMLPSNYYSEILAQDVLEHLKRDDTCDALREWWRLLAKDGILILRIPNLTEVLKLLGLERGSNDDFHNQVVQCIYGTQAYTGDFHLSGFTKLLIAKHLRECGFCIKKVYSKDGWLMEVVAEKVEVTSENSLDYIDMKDDWIFIEGWYPAEGNGNGLFRWGCKQSYINLVCSGKKYLELEVFSGFPEIDGKNVTLRVIDNNNGKILEKIDMDNNYGKRIKISLGNGGKMLRFYSDVSWVPKLWLDSNDDRELGIGVRNLKLF